MTMLAYLAGWHLGARLVLLLSDRVQLDAQLAERVLPYFPPEAAIACDSSEELVDAVRGGTRLIVSTIQKTWAAREALRAAWQANRGAPVVVICDEAHRSHGSAAATPLGLRDAFTLEATRFVGFTGTPSRAVLSFFQPIVHALPPRQGVHLGLVLNVLERPLALGLAPDADVGDKAAAILDKWRELRASGWPGSSFGNLARCMVLTASRQAVVEMTRALRRTAARAQRAQENAQVQRAPPPAGSASPIMRHVVYGTFSGASEDEESRARHTEAVLNQGVSFAQADVLVVCRKLETGFDEPRLGAMFVDRKLGVETACVQSLCRMNRRFELKNHEKRHCYLVDVGASNLEHFTRCFREVESNFAVHEPQRKMSLRDFLK